MNTKRYKPLLQRLQIERVKFWRRRIACGGKIFLLFQKRLRENVPESPAQLELQVEVPNLARGLELNPGARFPHLTYGASRA